MSTCPEKRPLLPLALLFLRIGIMDTCCLVPLLCCSPFISDRDDAGS